MIFNEAIPQDLGFVDRTKPDSEFDLEIDQLVTDKLLARIVDRAYRLHGNTQTAQMMDRIKALGFKYSTYGAITVSVSDIVIPKEKAGLIAKAGIRCFGWKRLSATDSSPTRSDTSGWADLERDHRRRHRGPDGLAGSV
jgi:DNA-directed RNA polymerase beta' subunit